MDKLHSRTTEPAVRLVVLPRPAPSDEGERPSAPMLREPPSPAEPTPDLETRPAPWFAGGLARELLALPPRLLREHRTWRSVRALLRDGATALFRAAEEPLVEIKQRAALRYLVDTHGARQLGDFLAFGLGDGAFFASMHAQLATLQLPQVRLFGFDDFAARLDEPLVPPDEVAALDLRTAERLLSQRGLDPHRCTLFSGIPAGGDSGSFRREHWVRKASVIALDLHGFAAPSEILRFCEPLIGLEACIFVLDRAPAAPMHRRMRQRRVFGEFLRTRPGFALHERGGDDARVSCYLLRRTAG